MTVYLQMIHGITEDLLIASLIDLCGCNSSIEEVFEKIKTKDIDYDIKKEDEKTSFSLKIQKNEDISYEKAGEIVEKSGFDKDTESVFSKILKYLSFSKREKITKKEMVSALIISKLVVDLQIENVYTSDIYQSMMDENFNPLPNDSVIKILENSNLKLKMTKRENSFTTDLGVSAVAALSNGEGSSFKIESSAFGTDSFSNILRIYVNDTVGHSKVKMINTNIDDCSPEVLAFVMEKLQKYAGDVYFSPVFMKKNRPAYNLTVTYQERFERQIIDIIFRHTTTIGLKKSYADTEFLETKRDSISVNGKKYLIKLAFYKNEIYIYPEYESAKLFSEDFDMNINQAYSEMVKIWEEENKKIDKRYFE